MALLFNTNGISHFYELMKNVNFNELTPQKAKEIDELVSYWYNLFHNRTEGRLSLMVYTAEKMTTSNGYYGVISPAEKVYFYVKMVDPEFYFLELSMLLVIYRQLLIFVRYLPRELLLYLY